MIDYSKIKLIPATLEDYPIIQNLGRFYAIKFNGKKYLRQSFQPGTP